MTPLNQEVPYERNANESAFLLKPEQVRTALSSLKRCKSPGPDGIPNWILKDFAEDICDQITSIFNASIQESVIPDDWKLADIVPINKTPHIKDINSDLRPISLTSSISKVMESFVRAWLMKEISDKIDIRQFGSLPKCSTAHALISMVHNWLAQTDYSKCVRIFLLDFSKAFDRIDHLILLEKMERMNINISLRRWVQSFLTNRKQRVIVSGAYSNFETVNGGVPQGTVLGPVLFLIMINDLVCNINERWKYVDDTTVSESIGKGEPSNMQAIIDDISYWCTSNNMKLNASKCKELLICFWRKDLPDFQPLSVDGTPVERVHSTKSLGLYIRDDLKWSDHILYMSNKASKRLFMLRTLKKSTCDVDTLLKAYTSCVRPILEYCAQVWHFNIPAYLSDQIERVHKRALRIIYPFLSYDEALIESSLQSLNSRREIICKSFFNKSVIRNNKMEDLLPSLTTSNTYNLRKKHQYNSLKCKTERFKKSFIPSVCSSYSQGTSL